MIGIALRTHLQPLASPLLELLGWNDNSQSKNKDELFAAVMVSLFMQIIAILQMPIFLGPTFSPFVAIYNQFGRFLSPFAPSQELDDVQNGDMAKTTARDIKHNSRKKESGSATKKASSATSGNSGKDKKL
jgi:hypothetical protein